MNHYYIERSTGIPVQEKLFSDNLVKFIYDPVRENFKFLFNLLTNRYSSKAAAYFNYDFPVTSKLTDTKRLIKDLNIDTDEFYLEDNSKLTPRNIFERKIKYWETRPMNQDPGSIVSPCDSRVITGEESENHIYFVKNKFFSYKELISEKKQWSDLFRDGSFAIFRLTPDKYHYNHSPVSGIVEDHYEINGKYHSCNPLTISRIDKPFCKNKRVVTIINTDVENGSGTGRVCMVEIVALMIGEIIQCYSPEKYQDEIKIKKGMFLKKGQPKSRFAPGSSTIILLFEKGRFRFDKDLVLNSKKNNIETRFSKDFTVPMVETDIKVREQIGMKVK